MSLFAPPHLLDSGRWKHMRVGLLGGSFNPPHEGHVHISLAALDGLQLDAIWWMVTPQNPLKKSIQPLPLAERVDLCRQLIDNPRIVVTDIEKDLGTVRTYDSVCRLRRLFPSTRFAWITGMDNALTLHRWYRWQDLLAEICMVHLTRAPAESLIQRCPLRLYTRQRHVIVDKGGRLPLRAGTTYWLLQRNMVDISSTELRERAASAGT